MDMIKHFKDESVMNCQLTFQVINERGQTEDGVGVGVNREVLCLFWNAFSNSMTIGETERVPSVRYDHFVEEWRAVGRIFKLKVLHQLHTFQCSCQKHLYAVACLALKFQKTSF